MAAASGFELLAAIDLHRGNVVRLKQGDFARETAYGADPIKVACWLTDRGAQWLHVVDLDGARTGRPVHASTIARIAAAVGRDVRVEVAGGLRTMDAVEAAFLAGAVRVVLGTAAIREPAFAGQVIERFGHERLAVALDIRDDRPVVDGWADAAGDSSAMDALRVLGSVGVTTFEVTAVERDGMLQGPDLDLLRQLVDLDRGRVVASGGIRTLDDVRAVRDLGCVGAIVGRALYEGRFELADVDGTV
jgi:phosphoribosylformimino-5-aminoimidazole carboxamide ribotide isomerase